jgi:hypothetical protein
MISSIFSDNSPFGSPAFLVGEISVSRSISYSLEFGSL